jgi:cyanophycinase-like exopeptidase
VTLPRLLVIMGSGETSPTMVKTHREVLSRLGPPPVPAVLLDTPFGFQANADDISTKAVEYFHESVGQDVAVASFRSAASADAVDYERMLGQLRDARFVFAGPGSPSYTLRQWSGTLIPKVLQEKLESGGCVTFASAAALTLGLFTVPVYEIYKVGEEPTWLEGLNLLGPTGLRAAVIPHFDNAEGGTHDTRFCYLGEPRLAQLEHELPPDVFVLGVDEHTGLVLDLEAGTGAVVGRGVVTVRKHGRISTVPSGEVVAIGDLARMAEGGSGLSPAPSGAPAAGAAAAGGQQTGKAVSPLLESVARIEAEFDQAMTNRDVRAAARAILDLEDELVGWSRDTLQSDEQDRARSVLRGMIVRLGEVAEVGARDPAAVVGPFVDSLLEARKAARDQRRWEDADALRDRLVALGVEVQDSPQGTSWRLLS